MKFYVNSNSIDIKLMFRKNVEVTRDQIREY